MRDTSRSLLLGALVCILGGAFPRAEAEPLTGIIVPMLTPLTANGNAIDVETLKSYASWLTQRDVDGLFVVSGMGQWQDVSLDEKKLLIKTVVTTAKGLKPVIAGIGAGSLQETLELAHFAEAAGAAWLAVPPPEFLRKGESPLLEGQFVDYLSAIHAGTHLPILVYDRKGELVETDFTRLTVLPRIRAIKYRTNDVTRFLEAQRAVDGKIALLSGNENNLVGMLAGGATGVVGGGATLYPQVLRRIMSAFAKGHFKSALEGNLKLLSLGEVFPGGRELTFALRRFFGLPFAFRGRKSLWTMPSMKEQDRMWQALSLVDAKARPSADVSGQLTQVVDAKAKRYLEWTLKTRDADGFIHNTCDGATFTSLACIANGVKAGDCPVYKAEDSKEKGLWFRHAKHDCFDKDGQPDGSRSDNSLDEFLMLGLLFWHYGDLKSVSNIIDYGEKHHFSMGRARAGQEAKTVIWPPEFQALYYELRYRLGGPDHDKRRALNREPAAESGFQSHLVAERILLQHLLTGTSTETELKTIKSLAEREPRNAVFQAIAYRLSMSDPTPAFKSLADSSLFPPHRLPTMSDHCEEFLFQRDERQDGKVSADWLACREAGTRSHSGTDFLWARCLLTPGCLRS